MKQTITAAIACSLLLSGCTSRSSSIAPHYVSSAQFDSYSCEQLAETGQKISAQLTEVSKKQDTQRAIDGAAIAVGAIVFLPTLLFLATPGHDDEIGRLKGQSIAIQEASRQKNCSGLAGTYAPPAAADSSATTPGPDTAALSPQDDEPSSLLVEQGKFDAWYAGNSTDLRDQLHRYLLQEGLIAGAPSVRTKILATKVSGSRPGGFVVDISWTQASQQHGGNDKSGDDSFFLSIENDQLVAIEHLGPAGAPQAQAAPLPPQSVASQTTALPWAGEWHGETELEDGAVSLTIVDGAVTSRVEVLGKSRTGKGRLDDEGRYSIAFSVPYGGYSAMIVIDGRFPDYTVQFHSGNNSYGDRTITVVRR